MIKESKYQAKLSVGFYFICIILTIWFSFFVSAFGIGSPGAIAVEPGQTVEEHFSILNKGENANNFTMQVTVETGSEYITLSEGDIFNVPAGVSVAVPITASVPENAQIGDRYPITFVFSPIIGGVQQGETIDIAFSHRKTLEIIAIEKPEPVEDTVHQIPQKEAISPLATTLIILIIIIFVVIIIVLIRKKSNLSPSAKPTTTQAQTTKAAPAKPK